MTFIDPAEMYKFSFDDISFSTSLEGRKLANRLQFAV